MNKKIEIVERLNKRGEACKASGNDIYADECFETALTIEDLARALEDAKRELVSQWDYWSRLADGSNPIADKMLKRIGRSIDSVNQTLNNLYGGNRK